MTKDTYYLTHAACTCHYRLCLASGWWSPGPESCCHHCSSASSQNCVYRSGKAAPPPTSQLVSEGALPRVPRRLLLGSLDSGQLTEEAMVRPCAKWTLGEEAAEGGWGDGIEGMPTTCPKAGGHHLLLVPLGQTFGRLQMSL